MAESLTGGLLASRFARAPAASEWFQGGVVAYASSVKFDLLGVPGGSVVSERAATAMVAAAARMFEAAVGLAVTGVGGPERQDGEPPAPSGWPHGHRSWVPPDSYISKVRRSASASRSAPQPPTSSASDLRRGRARRGAPPTERPSLPNSVQWECAVTWAQAGEARPNLRNSARQCSVGAN